MRTDTRQTREKSCGNKVAFATFADAERTLVYFQRKLGRREMGVQAAYHCRFCSAFHVGTTPPRVQREARGVRERWNWRQVSVQLEDLAAFS